jgi:hypothetical protein
MYGGDGRGPGGGPLCASSIRAVGHLIVEISPKLFKFESWRLLLVPLSASSCLMPENEGNKAAARLPKLPPSSLLFTRQSVLNSAFEQGQSRCPVH